MGLVIWLGITKLTYDLISLEKKRKQHINLEMLGIVWFHL